MNILPAIDLYNGCAVRLLRGDYAQMTTYSTDPAAVAREFAAKGAEWLHLVDLEGAKSGGTPNAETVAAIARAGQLKIEIGGGVRPVEVIERYLSLGVERVILCSNRQPRLTVRIWRWALTCGTARWPSRAGPKPRRWTALILLRALSSWG